MNLWIELIINWRMYDIKCKQLYILYYSNSIDQPEVYSLHFLVWKGFYICYK